MTEGNRNVVRLAFSSALVWLIFGVFIGAWESIIYAHPEIMYSLPIRLRPFVEFGKLRQIHVNSLAFAWLSIGFIGILLAIVPKLTNTALEKPRLAVAAIWSWNLAIIIGVIALDMGKTRAREYASLIWPSDALMILSFILLNIVVWKTLIKRKEKTLHVSLWYLAGSIVWMPLIIILGKGLWLDFFTNPFFGVFDNVANWFLGHNILGLWFTTLGIGASYFIITQMTENPIYNHKLSIIGFWSLVLCYPAVGAHHTLAGPVPVWLMAEATVFSVLMVIPVTSALWNIHRTIGSKWDLFFKEPSFAFLTTGLFFYFLVSLQGSFQAMRFVSQYLHFSQWVPAHAMLALGGGFTFICIAAIYYFAPEIFNGAWYSRRLQSLHFIFSLIGIVGIFLGLTVAGLIQGADWQNTNAGMHWIDATVRAVHPHMVVLAISGVLFGTAQIIFVINYVMSMRINAVSRVRLPKEVTLHA
ncbi:cbb3-type cytochrome c oxidase subunit I [Desulfosporosinus sp. SYSU MS00001]|uniref:cbb3-type cytochrome c oxidase subunit I n=1 Tax=Desulfosporosinus sp. SYSU MS00001 TaxID=3416284 RepID=UPI003CF333EA